MLLHRNYTEAPSVEYWATTFYKATANARREKLWKPKEKMLQEKITRYGKNDSNIIDIGEGYGIFAEEMKFLTVQPIIVIEPGSYLAKSCMEKESVLSTTFSKM